MQQPIFRLIKKLIYKNGKVTYSCALNGTDECLRIHNSKTSCTGVLPQCRMIEAMMEKLYIYETIEYGEEYTEYVDRDYREEGATIDLNTALKE